ncbi:MAG: hypothetical protein RLZZ543_449 [Bacteroidota bacterium]|jgi:uncharacterized membrane protein
MNFFSSFLSRSFRRFTGYFLKGLVLIVPIGITVYVVYKVFMFLDGLIPYEVPGVSILLIIFGTAFLGLIGTAFIQTPLKSFFNKTIERVPLIKFIYTSVRDMLAAFVGNEKRFNKPVMVRVGRDTDLYKLGFVTQKDLSHLGIKEGKSAVYMPHSYNFSGNLFIVDNDLISPIDAPADEIMKFIVSGGITRI